MSLVRHFDQKISLAPKVKGNGVRSYCLQQVYTTFKGACMGLNPLFFFDFIKSHYVAM